MNLSSVSYLVFSNTTLNQLLNKLMIRCNILSDPVYQILEFKILIMINGGK